MRIGLGLGLYRQTGPSGPPPAITGTSPVLAPLTAGQQLSASVTWGTYASTAGTVNAPTRQMQIDGGSWVAYVASRVVASGETFAIREIVTDTAGNSRTFTSQERAVPVIAGLRATVEALATPGGTGPRVPITNTLTEANVSSIPGAAFTGGGTVTLSQPVTIEGWRFNRGIIIDAPDVIIRDCEIYDPGTLPSSSRLIEWTANAHRFVVEWCDLRGSATPLRVDGTSISAVLFAGATATTDGIIRRNRMWDFVGDAMKAVGRNLIVTQNRIGPARNIPYSATVYDSALSYPAGSWVRFNGRPYLARVSVLPGQPPAGSGNDNAQWWGSDPHSDFITVPGGRNIEISYNLFEHSLEDAENSVGETQQIRIVRNTGTTTEIGPVKVFGNVFSPWPNHPLAGTIIREPTTTSYPIGSVMYQNGRWYRALVANQGSAQYPAVAPERWEETLDINVYGPYLWAHNWVATSGNAVGGTILTGQDDWNTVNHWGPNSLQATNEPATQPSRTVSENMPEPVFGAPIAWTSPASVLTSADVLIQPATFGRMRFADAAFDACVIRAGGRIVLWITPDGTATIPPASPIATVERIGTSNSYILRLRTAGGAPLPGDISVAAGTASVQQYSLAPVTAVLMGQSELFYVISNDPQFLVLDPPTLANNNLTVVDWNGTAAVPIPVTNATIAADQVNPAMAAMSAFLDYAAPGRQFVIGNGAVGGTARRELASDALDVTTPDGRTWLPFESIANAIDTTYGSVGHLIECWYNSDAARIDTFRGSFWPFYFGTDANGVEYPLGSLWAGDGYRLDHILWDGIAAPTAKGRGLFARSETDWHLLTPMPFLNAPSGSEMANFSANNGRLSEPARATLIALAPDTLAQSVRVKIGPSAHVCKFGGSSTLIHPDRADKDGLMGLMWPVALSLLRAAGQTINEPTVVGVDGPTDGSFADLLVSLPNGGTLTTLRTFRGGPAYAGTSPHRQQVTGLEVTRGGVRRPIFRTTETAYPVGTRGTVVIQSAGETHPTLGRIGRVRVTPTVPFGFGDALSYLRGQATASLLEPRDFNLYLDFLIEHIPGLYNAAALYPFEGVAVRPFQQDAQVTVPAAPFVARSALFDGGENYGSSSIAVPGTNRGMCSVWLRQNGTFASARTIFEFRVGTSSQFELASVSNGQMTMRLGITGGGNFTSTPANTFVGNQWYHVLWAWDFDIQRWQVYVNNTLVTNGRAWTGSGFAINGVNMTRIGVGGNSANGARWNGDIGHLYINLTESLDFSDPVNRARFALAGQPVNLGGNGQLPTGNAPAYYYDGTAPDWANLGTAGNVPLVGTGPLAVGGTPSY